MTPQQQQQQHHPTPVQPPMNVPQQSPNAAQSQQQTPTQTPAQPARQRKRPAPSSAPPPATAAPPAPVTPAQAQAPVAGPPAPQPVGTPAQPQPAGDDGAATPSVQPPAKKNRTNTPWTPQEELRLKQMRDAGNSWAEIAKVGFTLTLCTEGLWLTTCNRLSLQEPRVQSRSIGTRYGARLSHTMLQKLTKI